MEERNFGYLGFNFQQSLIKAIIEDKKYGDTIIDVIDSKYFENASFKYIMENVKEYYDGYNKIPEYETIAQKIMAENGVNKESGKRHIDTLEAIKGFDQKDIDYVKESAVVRKTKNVVNFVYWLGKPAEIPEDEINEIKAFLVNFVNVEVIGKSVKVGDFITVKQGLFAGKTAQVKSFKNKNEVRSIIDSLGFELVAHLAE